MWKIKYKNEKIIKKGSDFITEKIILKTFYQEFFQLKII